MARMGMRVPGYNEAVINLGTQIKGFKPDMLLGWIGEYFSGKKNYLDKCGLYIIRQVKHRFDNEIGYTGRWADLAQSTLDWRESHGYVYGSRFKKLRNTMGLFKTATRLNSNTRVINGESSGGAAVVSRWKYLPNSRYPDGILLELEGKSVGLLQSGGVTNRGGVVPGRPFWYVDRHDEMQFKRYIQEDILVGMRNFYRYMGKDTNILTDRIGRLRGVISRVESGLPKRGR